MLRKDDLSDDLLDDRDKSDRYRIRGSGKRKDRKSKRESLCVLL